MTIEMIEKNKYSESLRKPRVVAFEATGRCKMNCKHCRASAKSDCAHDLSTSDCKKIIKAVADYNRCVFIFTGGEPFERSDIFELIEYANSCGLATSVATCGYDFDTQKAQMLKNLGVLTLSFSLDSDDAKVHDEFRQTKGAFEKTLAAIEIAKKAGLKFQINTTVTKLNADKLPALAELSEKLGAYCFNPFMLVPAGRGKELSDIALSSKEYEKVLRIVADLKAKAKIDVRFTCGPRFAAVFPQLYQNSGKKTFGCLAATDFAFVSRTGDVQTCGFLKISAGNILQIGNFADIWEHSKLLNSIREKRFTGKCGGCEHVQICGGCRARAFAQTGDYLASDPLCCYGGQTSTLVAAHIEEDRIDEAANEINLLGYVSHNYLRKHHFNLWFTLKSADVKGILKDLSEKFNTEFYSFPSTVRYKVDSKAVKKHNPPENYNALVCLRAGGAAAEFLCQLPQVSHCYERQTLPDWPYNIYAMIHEKSIERIEGIVAQIVSDFKILNFQILPTIKSLKKV